MMYPFELLTHCGVNFAVDFGGNFWEAAIPVYPGYGAYPTAIDNPFQRGMMTLLDPDNALFTYPNGQIPFRRLGATKVVPGLCA